jgi:hypothetical protein
MKPEIKKLWVEALRSGKYKQGKYHLHTGDKYCCLGVLCDISPFPLVTGEKLPSIEVLEWSGLPDSNPDVWIKNDLVPIARVNDCVKGYGFKRIADLIEKHL